VAADLELQHEYSDKFHSCLPATPKRFEVLGDSHSKFEVGLPEKLLQVALPAEELDLAALAAQQAYGSMCSSSFTSFPEDGGGLPVFEDLQELAELLGRQREQAEEEACQRATGHVAGVPRLLLHLHMPQWAVIGGEGGVSNILPWDPKYYTFLKSLAKNGQI
jgi:hypothetical protein